MIQSHGVITGAGFETPAEVLQLGKKLMVIPIRGQYEQLCNAAALSAFGVTVLKQVDDYFITEIQTWLHSNAQQQVDFGCIAPKAVAELIEQYPFRGFSSQLLYPEWAEN